MQRSDELDDAFLALTISDCPGAVAMETDASESYDPGPEPPTGETDFNWMLATQFRKLHCVEELDLSMRAIASSSVHSDDVTMESCVLEEAVDLDAEIAVTSQETEENKTEEAEACNLVAGISVTSQETAENETDEAEMCNLVAGISVTSQETAGNKTEETEVCDPVAGISVTSQETAGNKTEEAEVCNLVAKITVTSQEIVEEKTEEIRELDARISKELQQRFSKSERTSKKIGQMCDLSAEIPVSSQEASGKIEPQEVSKGRSELSKTDEACSTESEVDRRARVRQNQKCADLKAQMKEKCFKLEAKEKNGSTANKTSASLPLSRSSSSSSPPDNSSSVRTGRKRSLDSSPAACSKRRACPELDGLVRVSLRTVGPWLQPADMAVLLVPFFFPQEPRLLFMDSSFASGPGWEGPGRPRQLVVPMARRKDFLEFYDGRPPRMWSPLPHYATEVAYLDSWRLNLESVVYVNDAFWPRRLCQLPPEPKQHFEGALRWASTFARTAQGILRHLHYCARVPRPRRPSEDYVVELRVENVPDEQVVLHALRYLIQGLAPFSGLIFRSRGNAPGWINLHVAITGDLLDAFVLISATNRRSLIFMRDTGTYVVTSGGLSRLQSCLASPHYLRVRYSRVLNRLGPKKSRLTLLQNLLRHLLASRPAPILPACCMDLVVRLGVCADDANLVARILLSACRSMRDYAPELTSGCLSGFKLDGAAFMCCADDAGLIELASQLIYCPCSTCTPFLYERGQIEPPSHMDLL